MGEPELTLRQLAILLHVYVAPSPHTVRGLAATFGLAKPAVTRALDRLCALELMRRKTDAEDKRSILVQRTVKGAVYMTEFSERIEAAGRIEKDATEKDPAGKETAGKETAGKETAGKETAGKETDG